MPKIEAVGAAELREIMPLPILTLWNKLIAQIEGLYEMEQVWDNGGKAAKYVLRFRRGGKTLVTLFPKEDAIGILVIYGKDERGKFEAKRGSFSKEITTAYDQARTYHDGKWITFYAPNEKITRALPALLAIKRKPNRKS